MAERFNAAVLQALRGICYPRKVEFYAYILKSLKDGKYYYGHCENMEARLERHNRG